MTEENVAAPAEQTSEAAPAAVESIEQSAPNIMMDKDVASDMASKATDANSIESGDPVEQGLNKGMKISGIAGENVADKVENDVSPVADVPDNAQLNAEGSSPSADLTPEPEAKAEETPEVKAEEPENEVAEEPEVKTEEVAEEPEEVVEEQTEEPEEVVEETTEEEPEVPEGVEPEGEPEGEDEAEENTPFGDPLRNVVKNMPQENVPIDQKTAEDSGILLTDVPGKLRIY